MGWLKTIRSDLSWATPVRRAYRAERKWLASSPTTREALGEEIIAELAKILQEIDVHDTEVFSDPENRLVAQVSVGMIACRIAVGLEKPAQAIEFANEFRRQFELMLDLAKRDRQEIEDPRAWKSLVEFGRLVREQYDMAVGS